MAHSYHHAVSSARKFGGQPSDYQAIHDWLDVIWTVKRFFPSEMMWEVSRPLVELAHFALTPPCCR